jgi:hypothetical protein
MTTVQNIIDRALRPMRDGSQEYFVDAELIEYINEAMEDLCSKERILSDEGNLSVSAGSAALPAAVLQVRWLRNPDGEEATWLDPSTFNEYQLSETAWDEDEPLATIYDDTVKVWPATTGTWKLGYWSLPTQMTVDSDTIPLPRIWERRIVRYTRAHCYYRLGEIDLGDREMQQYAEGLRSSDTNDRTIGGSVSLAVSGNVFDLDPETIHRGT